MANGSKESFWSSVPGMLTGLAALITAVGGLFALNDKAVENRRTQVDTTVQPVDAGCVIKGNVSQNVGKVYHLPNDKGYAGTEIDPSKGERWFCTEIEAQKAGWTRAKQD